MGYEIEKNIPLVKKYRTMRKYPFGDMGVGDSFLVPSKDEAIDPASPESRKSKVNALRAMTLENRKGDGRRFSSRSQSDGSMRIWRTQ